jgi:hypothetical protein
LSGERFVIVSEEHELAENGADVVLNSMEGVEIIFEFTDRVNDPSAPMGGICIKTYTNWTFEKSLPSVLNKLRPNE